VTDFKKAVEDIKPGPPKPMPNAELASRKRKQAVYSKTGSTLGLSALGLKLGAIASKSNARTKKFSKPLDEAAVTAGIGGAGIGGIGGYNFAAYTREDARREQAQKRRKVSKAMSGESAFGVIHKSEGGESSVTYKLKKMPPGKRRAHRAMNTAVGAGTGAALGAAVADARQFPKVGPGKELAIGAGIGAGAGALLGATAKVPSHEVKRVKFDVKKAYDPEEKRHQRAGTVVGATGAGSAALGYGAVKQGQKAKKAYLKSRVAEVNRIGALNNINPKLTGAAASANTGKSVKAAKEFSGAASKLRLKAITRGGKAAALGAGAAAAGATAVAVNRKANKRGRTYRSWYDES
jgi:hypothetical protein